MRLVERIRKILLRRAELAQESEALILAILPGNKLQLLVSPRKGRSFVTELKSVSSMPAGLQQGQRVRIRYNTHTTLKIEIL